MKLKNARKSIIRLLSITFVFISLLLPFDVTSIYAASTAPKSSGIINPVIEKKYGNNEKAAKSGNLFNIVVSAAIAFMMFLGALLTLLNLVEAGINWIGSGGDSSKIQKARDRILHAVIGLIILSASVAIWKLAKDFLGISADYSLLFP